MCSAIEPLKITNAMVSYRELQPTDRLIKRVQILDFKDIDLKQAERQEAKLAHLNTLH